MIILSLNSKTKITISTPTLILEPTLECGSKIAEKRWVKNIAESYWLKESREEV